jgi:hypothetical protein
MKKLVFLMAAIFGLTLVSCGGAATETTDVDTTAVDSVMVDTVDVDTVVVDTVAVVAE